MDTSQVPVRLELGRFTAATWFTRVPNTGEAARTLGAGACAVENSRDTFQTEAFLQEPSWLNGKPGDEMMADQTESLFVYGTLKPGFGNHRRIAEHVHRARPGTIQGILVDLGAFPGLIRGDGRVRGVLLAIDPQALAVTDFIEGYRADREQSLYVRERVEVDLADGEIVEAWTYFIAHPHRYEDRPYLIVGHADNVPIYCWPAK